MKHYGDITQIRGCAVEPVNVVIGGSPCQDLSIAGRRQGLAGERSGLFMEQIRIVKELRSEDEKRGRTGATIRPRFMVWENVPGAFSSNRGADFGAVLQETVGIVQKAPAIPMPKNGWPLAGCLFGEGGGWSVAWRVFDAQFWGVPQRRRRIALVADFGGLRAPEILFERESMPRDYPTRQTPQKCAPADAGNSSALAMRQRKFGWFEPADVSSTLTAHLEKEGRDVVCVVKERAGKPGGGKGALCGENVAFTMATHPDQSVCYPDVAKTLTARNDGSPCLDRGPDVVVQRPHIVHAAGFKGGQSEKARSIGYADEQAPTLGAEGSSLDPTVFCIQGNCIDRADTAGCNGKGWKEDQSYTINTVDRPAVVYDARGNGSGRVAPTITGDHQNRVTDFTALAVAAVDCRNGTENERVNGTLQAKSTGGQSSNLNNVARQGFCVRRMTPLECERLQGYPDGWTDIGEWVDSKGKTHKECTDSQRYKALGNSIALPSWVFVLQRLSLCCDNGRTMASLFDGIGGFPLIWESLNGKGSCLWASEIEEFPIAVTKYHFPD